MMNADIMEFTSVMAAGVVLVCSLIMLAVAAVSIVALWRIFEKAGQPGWAALIPFYNSYVLFKLAWGNGWMFLLTFLPIANIVASIMVNIKLAHAFGKEGAFAVGLIFLPFIFQLILAFDRSRYIGPDGAPPTSSF